MDIGQGMEGYWILDVQAARSGSSEFAKNYCQSLTITHLHNEELQPENTRKINWRPEIRNYQVAKTLTFCLGISM